MNPHFLMPLLLWAAIYWAQIGITLGGFLIVAAILITCFLGRWIWILLLTVGFGILWLFNPAAARQAWRDQQ